MLKVEGIHTQYGKIKVLSDVSFEISPGEIVALIGTNGAGKSTFLKTISGLVRPTQGRITFMDKNIQGLAPEKIVGAGIAHVPEGRNVFARQTVMTRSANQRLYPKGYS